MKFVYNPRTCQFEPEQKRPEDDIRLMSQCPPRSCWIKILQNRVNLNSVGNKRYAKIMWFDLPSKTVSTDTDMKDATLFRSYILPGVGRPGGWLPVNGPQG